MTIYYEDASVTVHHGDCLRDGVLRALPDCSVDSVVTDPPYNLKFMSKTWDSHASANAFQQWCQLWASECLRVLKPGGHLLAFGGTRTSHRLACAIEDAGFEIRDSIAWLYGSGFPKSLDVSKAIDKAAGATREVVGSNLARHGGGLGVLHGGGIGADVGDLTAPATDDARTWQGWGTALKPAHEPIVVARKPLVGTVAGNVLAHGTGALNIDACRIGDGGGTRAVNFAKKDDGRLERWDEDYRGARNEIEALATGRWPANVVLDESQAAALDAMSGETISNVRSPTGRDTRGVANTESQMVMRVNDTTTRGVADHGGASRFMYTAKADARERVRIDGVSHPTVKPLSLMRWLVRLVTPPGGTVLEPFAGSGTTVEACILEGFKCIAIEREADYLPLIVQRIQRRRDPVAAILASDEDPGLFGGVA